MIWRVLVIAVVAVHVAYVALVPAGGFIAWRYPKFTPASVLAVLWALASIALRVDCPLTALEDNFEVRAGGHPRGEFVDRYVKGYVVPHGHDGLVQLCIGLAVVIAYAALFVRWRRARAQNSRPRPIAGLPSSRSAGL